MEGKAPLGIQEYVKALLLKQGITLEGLAKKLGYKSRTSLDRIMNATARADSVRKLEKALLDAFPHTEREAAELHNAVQIAIYGREKFLAAQQMWNFVQGAGPRGGEIRIVAATGEEVDLLQRYSGREARIVVVNCQYIFGLFPLMKRLLRQGRASVEQYVLVNQDDARTICAINSLMEIFYERGYDAYVRSRNRGDGLSMDCGLNEADMVITLWKDADGKDRADMILFSDSTSGVLTEIRRFSESFVEKIGLDKRRYAPIKRAYFQCGAFEDYVKYSADYAELERNRAVWKIKPDVGVDQIPVWCMKNAMLEGELSQNPQFLQVLEALEDVYRRRVENTWQKRRHSHVIMKYGAMRRFAMTGRSTDHFWAMRPYTPRERIAILSKLLEQQRKNPYVHLYFLRNESRLRDVEIAYYEGAGMLILESNTDYNLERNHSEVMITHPEMLQMYREFYMEVLVRDCVYSETETCEYLEKLIALVDDLC